MSDKKQCCVKVNDTGTWSDTHRCTRSATVERDGKWYCKIHDPEYRREKFAKSHEKFKLAHEQNKKRELARAYRTVAQDQNKNHETIFGQVADGIADALEKQLEARDGEDSDN